MLSSCTVFDLVLSPGRTSGFLKSSAFSASADLLQVTP